MADVTVSSQGLLPDIPNSWIIAILAAGLVILRYYNIDSYTTAALGMIIGYVTGKHVQQTAS